MTVFEWLQSCTKEELAEWLLGFQEECEDSVVQSFIEQGFQVTRISLHEVIELRRMVEFLDSEVEEDDIE